MVLRLVMLNSYGPRKCKVMDSSSFCEKEESNVFSWIPAFAEMTFLDESKI